MTTKTLHHAKVLWQYFASFSNPFKADVIVVCCSYDLRVCDYACALLDKNNASKIIFSGKTGNWTKHLWDEPEAIIFINRALVYGINPNQIQVETEATNIGENIFNSTQLIPNGETALFITKPNTILRVKLTLPVQAPNLKADVACPALSFPADISNIIGVFALISEMVGDIQRIVEYPALGYQISHSLPSEVMNSYKALLESGFNHHRLNNRKTKRFIRPSPLHGLGR